MDVEIRHRPAFATMFIRLVEGSKIIVEADGMVSQSKNVNMETRTNGNVLSALAKRFFGYESFFVNEFTVPSGEEGQLVVSQPNPGAIVEMQLDATTGVFMQPGSYIASEAGVTLSLHWAGFASWLGGEGLFRLKASGSGRVWFGGYGGIIERQIDGDFIVDTGHLLAYEPSLTMSATLPGGIFSSFFGGEGLVSRLSGKGKIYVQTRNMDGLAAWTNKYL